MSASDCGRPSTVRPGATTGCDPDYPEALFDDLIALAGLTPGDHLLEVGCATGLATRPLARRGFRITCIELGAELAAVARQNLAGWPVEVVQGQFEEWPPREPYGLVYAATAWHWIDPGRALPAGLAGAAARRSPGHLGGGTRVPRGRRPVLRARSRTSTTRSARGSRPARAAAARRTPRRPGRDRGQRALRGHRRPPLRLGAGLPGRGVHRAARHVLRAPGHGGLETQEVVRRDQAAARAAAGPLGAAALGSGAAGRPASRAGGGPVSGTAGSG